MTLDKFIKSLLILFWAVSVLSAATNINYSDSIKKYQLQIKQSPNNEPAWFQLQNLFIQNRDFTSALKLEKISLSDRLYWGYVRTLFYTNQFDSTMKYIFSFAQQFPKSQYVNDALSLGLLILENSQDTMGLKQYVQCQYDYELGNYNQAIERTKTLLAKSNRLAEYSYLLLSKLFIAQGQVNQAIATLNEFEQKFKVSKLYPKTQYELGVIYIEAIKDTIKARNIFEKLISSYPECPESHFARGYLTILDQARRKDIPK